MQERIKMLTKHTLCYKKFLEIKIYLKKTKIKTEEHNNRQIFNICIRSLDTNKERQKANKHFSKKIV